MGFGLPFISTLTPFLFWLVKDVYKTLSPPPQEFALGPTCLVVKGRGGGNSLDFFSALLFLGFVSGGKEHNRKVVVCL